MWNNIRELPEDARMDEVFKNIQVQFINTLSENNFTISQTRYLFNTILNQFETEMPVTNCKQSLNIYK